MMRWLVPAVILVVCLAAAAVSQTGESTAFGVSPASFGVMKYFPGDVVHIVVEAPSDVVSVTALMPDGEQLNLSFNRRTQVWHNYWEVPAGFKKGGYTAKLRAVDVEGRVFEGETELFYVGEPTLPMVMRIEPTKEARLRPAAVKKPAEKKEKIAKKAVVKPKKAKKAKKVAVKAKPGYVSGMRLMIEAREYLFKHDYGKTLAKLDALLKIDPGNSEIRAMRNQIARSLKSRKR